MQITAYYDILCPFSYLAKRYLDLSIERFPDVTVDIELRPFMLHPTLPITTPHSFRGVFTGKYGDEARVPMWDRVIALGADVGISFAFYRIEHGAHAIHGHRTVHFAKGRGLGRQMLESIYTAFYEKARYIGDVDTLVELATAVGMPGKELRAYLGTDQDVEAIFALTERYRVDPGVTGMPFHVVEGRPIVLQSLSDWSTLFENISVTT